MELAGRGCGVAAAQGKGAGELEAPDAMSKSAWFGGAVAFLLETLGEKDLEQRLVGYIALVGEDLQVLDHGDGQAQGDGSERRLEVGEARALGGFPVDVCGGVVRRPELPFLGFELELRNSFRHGEQGFVGRVRIV